MVKLNFEVDYKETGTFCKVSLNDVQIGCLQNIEISASAKEMLPKIKMNFPDFSNWPGSPDLATEFKQKIDIIKDLCKSTPFFEIVEDKLF